MKAKAAFYFLILCRQLKNAANVIDVAQWVLNDLLRTRLSCPFSFNCHFWLSFCPLNCNSALILLSVYTFKLPLCPFLLPLYFYFWLPFSPFLSATLPFNLPLCPFLAAILPFFCCQSALFLAVCFPFLAVSLAIFSCQSTLLQLPVCPFLAASVPFFSCRSALF